MLIAAISLTVSSFFNTSIEIRNAKEHLVEQMHSYAQLIAFNASTTILFDDPETEESRLVSFQAVDIIDNIHIYKWDEFEERLIFFASYNKPSVPTVKAKIDDVNKLSTPQFSDKYLEFMQPILWQDETIGQVYIRVSLTQLQDNQLNKLTLSAIIAVSVLLFAFILALKMQRKLTLPIEEFIRIVQTFSRNKDYSVRVPKLPVKELDILGKAFNTMLQKVAQTLTLQEKTENEVRQLNQSLEEKVNQRTIALKESNSELLNSLETVHQYQKQIVENEKMASLGQMVAGVAHEVNTPIGLGVTASTLMADKLTDIKEAFDNKKLSAKQLERFLNDGEENLSIIYRNLNRAAELISSFKQVAVDQSDETPRQFVFSKLIHEVMLSLKPNLKKVNHHINIDCDESIVITSKPGPINQIFINLIMNSILHAFDDGEEGTIDISVQLEDRQCKVVYKDSGKGIPIEIRDKIFDPFVTTKRGEGGSGLGMHLVYNLVTQALHGSIRMELEVSQGVQFDISFPITDETQP